MSKCKSFLRILSFILMICISSSLFALAETAHGIKLGDSGETIKLLQAKLKDLGYFSAEVNGVFDNATQKALIAFQQANGLNTTGIADSTTISLLYSSNATPAIESKNSYEQLSPITGTDTFDESLVSAFMTNHFIFTVPSEWKHTFLNEHHYFYKDSLETDECVIVLQEVCINDGVLLEEQEIQNLFDVSFSDIRANAISYEEDRNSVNNLPSCFIEYYNPGDVMNMVFSSYYMGYAFLAVYTDLTHTTNQTAALFEDLCKSVQGRLIDEHNTLTLVGYPHTDILTIKESSFALIGSSNNLNCSMVIHNNLKDKVILDVSFRLTARNSAGEILGSEDLIIGYTLYPDEDCAFTYTIPSIHTMPDYVEFEYRNYTGDTVFCDIHDIPKEALQNHSPIKVINTNMVDEYFAYHISGTLYNPNSRQFIGTVCALLRNANGELLYGDSTYAILEAGATSNFDIRVPKGSAAATCDVYVPSWETVAW